MPIGPNEVLNDDEIKELVNKLLDDEVILAKMKKVEEAEHARLRNRIQQAQAEWDAVKPLPRDEEEFPEWDAVKPLPRDEEEFPEWDRVEEPPRDGVPLNEAALERLLQAAQARLPVPPAAKKKVKGDDAVAAEKKLRPKPDSIAGIFGVNAYAPEQRFGFEIEMEGAKLPAAIPGFEYHKDPSLRGAENAEFVFDKPKSLKDAKNAMDILAENLAKSQLKFSFRTSVHVHLNMSMYSYLDVRKVIYLLLLLENPLVHYCGPDRIGNRFCLRVKDASFKVQELIAIFTDNQFPDENNGKYSAINLAPIPRLGTIEVRTMRGTIEKPVLNTWFDILNIVVDKALTFKSVADIYETYLKMGAVAFTKLIMEEFYPAIEYPELAQEVEESAFLLIELPYLQANNGKPVEIFKMEAA